MVKVFLESYSATLPVFWTQLHASNRLNSTIYRTYGIWLCNNKLSPPGIGVHILSWYHSGSWKLFIQQNFSWTSWTRTLATEACGTSWSCASIIFLTALNLLSDKHLSHGYQFMPWEDKCRDLQLQSSNPFSYNIHAGMFLQRCPCKGVLSQKKLCWGQIAKYRNTL